MSRKARAFSCSKFSNKNPLTFLIEVLIILDLFVIIEVFVISDLFVIEVLVAIKASGGKH